MHMQHLKTIFAFVVVGTQAVGKRPATWSYYAADSRPNGGGSLRTHTSEHARLEN